MVWTYFNADHLQFASTITPCLFELQLVFAYHFDNYLVCADLRHSAELLGLGTTLCYTPSACTCTCAVWKLFICSVRAVQQLHKYVTAGCMHAPPRNVHKHSFQPCKCSIAPHLVLASWLKPGRLRHCRLLCTVAVCCVPVSNLA